MNQEEEEVSDLEEITYEQYCLHLFERFDDIAAEMNYKKRKTGRNKLARLERHDASNKRSLVEIPAILRQVYALYIGHIKLIGPQFEETRQKMLKEEENLCEEIFKRQYVESTIHEHGERRTPKYTSVDLCFSSLQYNICAFTDLFLFDPEEVKRMAAVLFGDGESFEVKDRGRFSFEECMLVVCCRMHLTLGTFQSMAILFDRDPAVLCDVFRTSADSLVHKHEWLIDVNNLNRFASVVPEMKRVMLAKYCDIRNDPNAQYPPRFRGGENGDVNLGGVVNGSRFVICTPGLSKSADIQRSYFSAYIKLHNINTLVVVLPNGIRACMTAASGRHSDPYLLSANLLSTLAAINMPVLGDSIFASTPFLRAMERRTNAVLDRPVSAAISSLRVMVEWSFSRIKTDFPLVTTTRKLKLFVTAPLMLIKLSMLLSNFRCCLRGEQVNTYFDVLPPKFENYVEGGVTPMVDDF